MTRGSGKQDLSNIQINERRNRQHRRLKQFGMRQPPGTRPAAHIPREPWYRPGPVVSGPSWGLFGDLFGLGALLRRRRR
jgi:hypothetical protein